MTISNKLFDLIHSDITVSSEYAKDARAPGEIAQQLYNDTAAGGSAHSEDLKRQYTAEDLQRARECGKWGQTEPSELFLKIYHDVLLTIEKDTLAGVVSPPLMGSSGTLPLTIISTVPDICRHWANVIVRAETEVFLATNYWQSSYASTIITNAIRELSKRAGERGQRMVVKVMYDRGNVKQVIDNHQTVSPQEWTAEAVQLPAQEDIPHIDMQVINYHRPVLGTFHCKYMVVDRKIALLSSNNIQDNDNLEMMTHIEGPVVDSFYDLALLSWHNKLEPPLPSRNSPAAFGGLKAGDASSVPAQAGMEATHMSPILPTDASVIPVKGETGSAQVPIIRLPENTPDDPHWDKDIAAEVVRIQSVVSPQGDETRMQAVTRHLNTNIQPNYKGDAPECAPGDEMTPYIVHVSEIPFPIAMVNRKPYGTLNHGSVYTPQNEAWLSAIHNAEKSVFIQTPTLNAEPLIPALLDAARRGIKVICYVCLGYNDAGELLPLQGGTNEMISNKMYTTLEPEYRANLFISWYTGKDMTRPVNAKFKHRSCHIKLMIVDDHIGIQGNGNQDTQSWYHSQEVNVMIDSPSVCRDWIEGLRRNQNTHLYGAVSQEDGVWRDAQGNEVEGSIGIDPGKFSWARGIIGAVQRVRGAGGF